ncbi:MAG: endolytic transglycosylase MltG [Clostridia bacterium]|nr:endolytic transglycosylase MltG [Clostridia bacterium]
MDDRFHNEDLEATDKYSGVAANEKKTSLGDFSENIDSNGSAEPTVAPRTKKFEVHIPDIYQEPVVEAPEYKGSTDATKSPDKPTAKKVQKPQNNNSKSAAKTKTSNKRRRAPAPSKTPSDTKSDNKAVKSKATKRYDFIKNLLISCVCFIFIAIITASVSTVAIGFINDILVISDDSEFSAIVEIPEGATYDEVFDILCDEGLVRQPFLTDFFLRFRHYDKVNVWNSETGQYEERVIKYEPGMYYLNYSDGIENMVESIMVKTNYAKDTVRLTFPEGWSVAQIFEKLEKYGVCEAERLYANLDIIGKQYGFISEIEADGGRYLTCEGYLFPDTYDFFVGESPSSVLKKLFNNFEGKWSEDYTDRLEELGMTMDEVIIIASIIQREAKDGSQMKDISSVIHNRLSDSVNFPNIQMNSTTDYITAIRQYNLFSDSYFALYLDRYNTYKVTGLPPGPICNPGKTAINAALNPSDTNYYFFCHDKSGNVYYAATAQEHAQNTSKVLYD